MLNNQHLTHPKAYYYCHYECELSTNPSLILLLDNVVRQHKYTHTHTHTHPHTHTHTIFTRMLHTVKRLHILCYQWNNFYYINNSQKAAVHNSNIDTDTVC